MWRAHYQEVWQRDLLLLNIWDIWVLLHIFRLFPTSSAVLLVLVLGLWTGMFHFLAMHVGVRAWPPNSLCPCCGNPGSFWLKQQSPKMETACISELLHSQDCFAEVLGTAADCEHEINSFGLNHWVPSWLIRPAKWQEYYSRDEMMWA